MVFCKAQIRERFCLSLAEVGFMTCVFTKPMTLVSRSTVSVAGIKPFILWKIYPGYISQSAFEKLEILFPIFRSTSTAGGTWDQGFCLAFSWVRGYFNVLQAFSIGFISSARAGSFFGPIRIKRWYEMKVCEGKSQLFWGVIESLISQYRSTELWSRWWF